MVLIDRVGFTRKRVTLTNSCAHRFLTRLDRRESHFAVFGRHLHRVAARDIALQQPYRQGVLDQRLNRTLQRAGTVNRIVALLRK